MPLGPFLTCAYGGTVSVDGQARSLDLHLCQELQGFMAVGTLFQHAFMAASQVSILWLQSLTLHLCQKLQGLWPVGTLFQRALMAAL